MSEISQNQLLKEMEQQKPPLVIDVRSGFEYRSAHIKDSVHMPFYAILWNKKRLPNDTCKPIILTCEHGPRAIMAKRLLRILGYRNVRLLTGHMTAWKKNRLPTV
jgi:hydroxyacylglutathione hydrolase